MKISEEQFNTIQKNFLKRSLSASQKKSIIDQIYIQAKKEERQKIPSPYGSYAILFRQKTLIVVMIVVLLSGTTFASAKSLPGDLLYGIKINIIEPVNLALRFTEKSKNEYRLKLLQVRIDENEKPNKSTTNKDDTLYQNNYPDSKNNIEIQTNIQLDSNKNSPDLIEKANKYNNLNTEVNLIKELKKYDAYGIDARLYNGKQIEDKINENIIEQPPNIPIDIGREVEKIELKSPQL